MPASRRLGRLGASVALLSLLVSGAALSAPAASAAPGAERGAVVTTASDHAPAARRETRQPKRKKPPRALRAYRIARGQLGDPYSYGAAGPRAFDCSGLVFYSARRAGFRNVPRTSSAQGRFMRRIPRKAVRKGDFVFFTDRGGVYHVGFYNGFVRGRRTVVHSPYSGGRVRVEPIWSSSWFAGTLRRR